MISWLCMLLLVGDRRPRCALVKRQGKADGPRGLGGNVEGYCQEEEEISVAGKSINKQTRKIGHHIVSHGHRSVSIVLV